MEKIEFEDENKIESRGRDIKINVIFVRHGEKEASLTSAETELSERGRKESVEYGKKLGKKQAIKSFASRTGRTRETAKLITATSPTEKKMVQRERDELFFHYDPEGAFAKEGPKIKKRIFGDNINQLTSDEKRAKMHEYEEYRLDDYLSYGEKRPDPGTYSPVETAAVMAKILDRYLRMAEKLKSGSNIDLINSTHDYPLISLLRELIIRNVDGKKIKGFDSVKEIGGPFDYNEGYEILIETNEQGDKSVKMKFRGNEYEINMERLKELVEISKNLEQPKL